MSVLRTRSIGAVVALACAALGLFAYANPAISQSGPGADCTGDTVATLVTTGFGDRTNRIYSFTDAGQRLTQFTIDVPAIGAGTYDVNAVSYDGYTSRAGTLDQPSEIWFANLLDGDGNVLATTTKTADLADNVIEAFWAGSAGTVSWDDGDVVALQFVHGSPGAELPNSVSPSCLGFTSVTPDEPVDTPIEIRVDTPVEVQGACELNPAVDASCCEAVDTDGNMTNDCEVEPDIVATQVPDPIPLAPKFTG